MITIKQIFALLGAMIFLAGQVSAQSVLFDFDSAPRYSSLPMDVTIGGLTAHLSATGQGFSIQAANTMGFTPAGFAGNCIYPNSVYAADLKISFSQLLTNFSIMYAPQELACDSSARMRVTAYQGTTLIGTSTTTADPPGTWPTGTLTINSAQGFDNVVVHYDAPPPTGGDWGPIFLADNMTVTPKPVPTAPTLDIHTLANQIEIRWPTNTDAGFKLMSKTNLALNTNWTYVVNVPAVVGTNNVVSFPIGTTNMFFLLKYP